MAQLLTVLYTANIRGDLDLLPRLYTFLHQLRRQHAGPVLLLDAGGACADSAWHCAQTGGRSVLLVLDAMGYDAANVCDFLTEEGRERLSANLMKLAVLCAGDSWFRDGVAVTTGAAPSAPYELHIWLAGSESVWMEQRTLHLSSLTAGQVGLIQVGGTGQNGGLTIVYQEILAVPSATLPDPTISATVDFVRSEARYYQTRRGDSSG